MYNSIIILRVTYSFPTLMTGKYKCNNPMYLSNET